MPENAQDATAIAQLRPRLYAFARRTLHDDADADDATQDALVALLRAPAPFRGEASLQTYTTAILKHKIADLVRARVAERRAHALAVIEAQCLAETAPDPGVALMQRRRRDRFWPTLCAQLRTLPPLAREAFILRLLGGCDVKETSRRLGISRNHTAVLTSRACKRLRGALDRASLDD